ncbi:MAG: methyltransferase domain-containing protein [Syntrophales bacterium]|jgi:ubiquinone/menaquinone biosynthesis C-methylase UbiE
MCKDGLLDKDDEHGGWGNKLNNRKHRVCPVEIAGGLDNRVRRWIQNPRKILKFYVKEGMTILDVGCGPGFFAIEMARMVGKSGRIIAADLQEGMLQKLRDKIQGTELEERITLHKSEKNRIGVSEKVDFILAFYVVHELPNQRHFFEELISILKPKGRALIVEPPLHVSYAGFKDTIRQAREAGLVR